MREPSQIVAAFESLCAGGLGSALATVVGVEGSSYRRPGARMLVAGDGRTWGGVSGGCLERDVARRARGLIRSVGDGFCIEGQRVDASDGELASTAHAILCRYETEGGDPESVLGEPGPTLGCGGRIEVLIEPISAASPGPMPALLAVVRQRRPTAMATVIRVDGSLDMLPGERRWRVAGQDPQGRVSDRELQQFMDDLVRRPPTPGRLGTYRCSLTGGRADVLVEWLRPPRAIVVFGDGYDVAPLVEIAGSLGWYVTVVGVQPVAALRRQFPGADGVVHAPAEDPVRGMLPLEPDAAAVVMGHHLERDAAVLRGLFDNPPAYVGVLGPRHRTDRLLAAAGLGELSVLPDWLFTPVGLDLGAETPEQIALAIVAEATAVFAGCRGRPLRDRDGPIHPVPVPASASIASAEASLACPA